MVNFKDDRDGRIWVESSGDASYKYFTLPDNDVNVLDSKYVDRELWFKVEILSPGPCEFREQKVVGSVWVRAYSKTGKTNVCFTPGAVRFFKRTIFR